MTNLLKDVPVGKSPPEIINVVVEIPYGTSNKYEYEDGYFKLDRVLHSALYYPVEYGFIPQTAAEDGDALDAMLLVTSETFPGCVVAARPIGYLSMEDEGGIDHKILAVPIEKLEPRLAEIKDITDVASHVKKEIELFMADYKKLEPGKWAKVNGWSGKNKAIEAIKAGIAKYKGKS